MQTTIALLGLAAVAYAAPQAALAPTASAPAGCSPSYSGTFEISAYNTTSKRDLSPRAACGGDGTLVITLANGKLADAKNRVGEIVANYQFQFDPEPQTGAIYTSGFSACSNGSLALGGSAVFYQCLSGGFYNLYDRSWAPQCQPILLGITPCGSGSGPAVGGAPAVSQKTDGQPTGTAATPISQQGDGQPTGAPAGPKPVSQISDGQPQAASAAAAPKISQIGDGQVQVPTARVSQIADGQIQVKPTPAAPVSQIGDGQVQATTAAPKPSAPISQISDGQIQATTAPKISQISDGQIQATTAPKISQISDGQIQASATSAPKISQISDGQIQATGKANSTTPPLQVANSGSSLVFGSQLAAIVLGAAAAALL